MGCFVGNYTVTESVPAGYHAAGHSREERNRHGPRPPARSGPKAAVTFLNIPLTNLSV